MKSIAIQNGLMMFAGFLAFFLLMHLTGMSDNYYFRLLNGIIHIVFISLAIRQYGIRNPEEFNYLSAVWTGMYTTVVGVIPFAVFMLIFLYLNPGFMNDLSDQITLGREYFTPITATLLILMEGLMVGLIMSYIIMRIVESSGAGSQAKT